MSFIPFIRDYIELLNTLYDSVSTDINIQQIFQETCLYLFQTIKFILFYLFTFQWFRDIISLPILIPQISNSILKENFFLQTPLENTFTVLEIPSYTGNKFLIGFLNSFFLALPLSCAHLLYARRLLIQGPVAGMAAGFGNIIGQLFFIGSVIFGFRFLVISWFSFEPLPYIFGVILLLVIIYDMVHERVIKIIDWKNQNALLKIFLLNFLLIWTEQSCVFQYLGNLTVSPDSSILESFAAKTYSGFLSTHFFYLIGLFIGSLFFNIIFAFLLQNLSEFIQIKLGILRSTWIVRLNISLLSLTVAFTFSSIPFYGLDFLVTQPLGFVSEDKAFSKTLFSPNEVGDPYGMLGGYAGSPSLNSDVTTFDRGFYLKPPILQTFEDLNYSGEYAVTSRQGNIPLFDQYKFKARQIRELLVKKSDGETEKNKQAITPSFNEQKIASAKEESQFDYPTYYPIDTNIFISPSLQKRFMNTYKEPFNAPFENALLGTLNTFFVDEKFTLLGSPQLDAKLKQKYYSNPVYKFLLNTDIDTFLKRQPTEYLLSPIEEKELYKKRLVLGRYNDSLRFYNTLPYTEEFQHFFNGSKSFADRVYNQQFKGTLHIVRRLFSLSFDSETKNPHELIIRYDQPLFLSNQQKGDQFNNAMYHEEVSPQNFQGSLKSPMVELVGQSPLYIGWDEDLRKILITNRLLQRSVANFVDPVSTFSKETPLSSNNEKEPIASIAFTTWPIQLDELENQNSNVLFNARLLFQTRKTVEKLDNNTLLPLFSYLDKDSGVASYQALPNNLMKLSSGVVDIIPPNRGGFIWPGTSSLKFSLADIFKS